MSPAAARPARRHAADAAAGYAAPAARRRTPWREAGFCALDFELTGLDPRRTTRSSRSGRSRSRTVVSAPRAAVTGWCRPEPPDQRGVDRRVHGIRAADLARAPRLGDAIDALLRAITGRILVVHTAAVERAFLGARSSGKARGCADRSSIRGARAFWLHERDGHVGRRLGLGELATALGLPADRPHDALGDALTTAQAFIALATHLDALHSQTVSSLTGARRTSRIAPALPCGIVCRRDRGLARLQTGDLARDARRRGDARRQPLVFRRDPLGSRDRGGDSDPSAAPACGSRRQDRRCLAPEASLNMDVVPGRSRPRRTARSPRPADSSSALRRARPHRAALRTRGSGR